MVLAVVREIWRWLAARVESVRGWLWVTKRFRWTYAATVLSLPACWYFRMDLLELWIRPLVRAWAPYAGNTPALLYSTPSSLFVTTVRVTLATTCMLVVPVFAAEGWLLIAELRRVPRARRLWLPFSMTTATVLGGVATLVAHLAPTTLRSLVLLG